MKGFCYLTHQSLDMPPAYWRQRLLEVLAAGGRRRVQNGETFIHEPNGPRIQAEVYGNVPAPTDEEIQQWKQHVKRP
jgi:hypothetical protein